jgi:hypothetical protein
MKAALVVFLLPLFFVAHGYAQYVRFIPPGSVLLLLLQYEAGAFVIWWLMTRWLADSMRGALATLLTLCFYFFFGPLKDSAGGILAKYSVWLPLWIICWLVLLLLIRRMRSAAKTIRFSLLALSVLLAIDAIAVFRKQLNHPPAQERAACTDCPKPDVYLLLLDGYAGMQQLQQEFGFSNRAFLDSLRGLGFKTMPGSRSNYQDTPFSIASLLNMEYLPLNHFAYTDSNLNYCYARVYASAVQRRFRNEGYRVFNHSIFDLEGAPALCENNLLVSGAALISSQTLGQRLYRDLYGNIVRAHFKGSAAYRELIFEDKVNNELFTRETLKAAAIKGGAPKFVYAHLEMPHAPYFYKEDGTLNAMSDLAAGNLHRKDLYLGYLKFTNRYTLNLVREIQRRSARPPVILLLGDHGFRYSGDPALFFSTLAAVSIPGSNYEGYNDSVTHVNEFRLLFHHLFRDSARLLPDRQFR